MNEMLRLITKAARGFSFYEEETLNGFMGTDQKFTFDYALQNDAAFIGRRTAFEKEAAALERQPENASAQALKERYQRIRTCEEHLGKNLWPEEETADEEKTAIEAAAAAREQAATNVAPRPQPNFGFGGGKSEEELERDLGTFSAQVAAEPLERKAPRGFRDACEHYLADLFPLSQDLLALILEGAAGLAAETIATKVKPLFDDPLVIHRLISYPPQRTRQELTNESRTMELYRAVGERTGGMSNQQRDALVQEELQKRVNAKISMSCGAHVDYGALTMIAEDKGKALEIERRGHPGQYEYLPEIPNGAFIVSTGFMLEKLTNGKIPAVTKSRPPPSAQPWRFSSIHTPKRSSSPFPSASTRHTAKSRCTRAVWQAPRVSDLATRATWSRLPPTSTRCAATAWGRFRTGTPQLHTRTTLERKQP